MRKSKILCVGVILSIVICFVIFFLPGILFIIALETSDLTWKNLTVEQLAVKIELEALPECEMIYNKETHGGLQGDGSTGIICRFGEAEGAALEKALAEAEHWLPLPMDPDIADRLYKTNTLKVLPIENGYYYFCDTFHNKYTLAAKDEDHRFWNYKIAAYDSDDLLLYYYGSDM